ncbi:uncharacterized protein M6B38_371610 [Iris pallida]|uniref:DUF7036 domain-containing protein n=1 Tax=Iris pallida TaxID=29817 RepID=A0AAX6GD51_IRIPA|nr:uncharacterized protein M6B38_371610 [Iris pallida]
MGKNEDDLSHSLPAHSSAPQGDGEANGGGCRCLGRTPSVRCAAALVLGLAVLLSALFWLPPFLPRGRGAHDQEYGGAVVVASFRVPKPVPMLNESIEKLRYDIFEEIGVLTSSVAVISMEPLGGSNWTNVVFGIWPNPKSLTISSVELSIIRASFVSFVIQQQIFHLTTSLFGSSYFFQILKFPGGITIIPPQSAFLLQKVHVLFNFTLNFPIYQVQDKLSQLKDQMKSGLLLNSYENLYVRLTNLKGSTVTSPTVVQTSVLLAVGNNPPSVPRLRQLAQNIRSSSDGNLGLNHTVFGRVKQIQLSSFLQHSLNSGGNGISMPPSPAPQPYDDHHNLHRHHHHHHHHHHRHHSVIHFAPAPAPQRTLKSPAPSGCHTVIPRSPKSLAHIVPAAAPEDSLQHSPSPLSDENMPTPPPAEDLPAPSPVEDRPTPLPNEEPPAPAPHLLHRTLPHVAFAHAQPPIEGVTDAKPPDRMSPVSPSPSSSSVAGQLSTCCRILLALLLYMLAHL